MNPFNVALTLHPVNGARFDVAADDALSAVVERSGGTLLAVATAPTELAADELCEQLRDHFTAGGHQPDSMAQAVAAVDRWLNERGMGDRLVVRPGVLPQPS